jgi:predicted ATPase
MLAMEMDAFYIRGCSMITRFQVDGFKNLVGVDLQFGPFTCIAGVNGVGKSNLFDAIRFLGALASRPLMDAAATVRGGQRASDVRAVFHHTGADCGERMRFDVEMIVPQQAVDDVGQPAKAATTFLRYVLELGLRTDPGTGGPQLEIRREALVPLKKKEAVAKLPFDNSPKWRRSVVLGRRGPPFVSTVDEEDGRSVIKRHQDGGGGNPVPALASSLRGTIVSVAQADAPTLLCARREMQSWLQLQLEPTALRQSSPFNAAPRLQPNGEGLAATLYRIARSSEKPEATYACIANRLAELVNNVSRIDVERNEKLEQLTLMLTDRQGTAHAARSLSDGTLRFLALTVLEMDPEAHGVLCLEEPENGIHPDHIGSMIRLLQDIAFDPKHPLDSDNPLRQVIVNTHSPLVVGECPDDSLVLAKSVEDKSDGRIFGKVVFRGVAGTWRTKSAGAGDRLAKGDLVAYLSPASLRKSAEVMYLAEKGPRRRIRDRADLQIDWLPGFGDLRVADE